MTATAAARGVEFAYDLGGDGPSLVWGHGLTSSMAGEDELGLVDWNVVRARARVLRYDARGHGESGSTADPLGYSWRALAEDQLALADQLGIDHYIAAGASMGCATALHAAMLAPDRIRALLLVIPPTAWATRAAQTDQYEVMASLVEAGRFDVMIAGAAERPVPGPFVGSDSWLDRTASVLRGTDPVRLARIFRGAATANLPDEADLARLEVPTLIFRMDRGSRAPDQHRGSTPGADAAFRARHRGDG